MYGRKLLIPRATDTACRFTFAELCEEALGPADYISIASAYKRIYIDEVPVLLLKQKNEARRLINLLDALCEYPFLFALHPLVFGGCVNCPRNDYTTCGLDVADIQMNPAANCTSARLHPPKPSSSPTHSPSRPLPTSTTQQTRQRRFKRKPCPRRCMRPFGQMYRYTTTRPPTRRKGGIPVLGVQSRM